MSIKYNVTGSDRKALVKAISEILALDPVYKCAPTFAYEIGCCTVDKNGTLTFSDTVAAGSAAFLVEVLKERGFEADEVPEDADSENKQTLVIEVPNEGFTDEALGNLKKIIASKDTLIKKALGISDLSFKVEEDKIKFSGFTLNNIDGEVDAYTRFACALCDMAKRQKRVIAKEQENIENEKLSMRLFLIRLGFIGEEYKSARKILLRNLTGDSAWKNKPCPAKAVENTDSDPEPKPSSENNEVE